MAQRKKKKGAVSGRITYDRGEVQSRHGDEGSCHPNLFLTLYGMMTTTNHMMQYGAGMQKANIKCRELDSYMATYYYHYYCTTNGFM